MTPAQIIIFQRAAADAIERNAGTLRNIPQDAAQRVAGFQGFLSQPVAGLSNTTYQQAIAGVQAWIAANPTNPSVPTITQTISDLQSQIATQQAYAQALATAIAGVTQPAL